MNSVFEAIKSHPRCFILSCTGRSRSTPSKINMKNHLSMVSAIKDNDWETVKSIIESSEYQKPLTGVVYCLDTFSDIDNDIWCEIVELMENGQIV